MRDLYEVLGVDRKATPTDLKKAYRRLAIQYHPDKNPGNKAAEEKFKEAANAYQILSDDDQRLVYDQFGFDGLRGRGAGPGPGFSGFSNVDDIFTAFGDLFRDFFVGRTSDRRRPGADLQIDLKITFAEAVWGCTKDVEVTRDVALLVFERIGQCQTFAALVGQQLLERNQRRSARLRPAPVTRLTAGVPRARAFRVVTGASPVAGLAGAPTLLRAHLAQGRGVAPRSVVI